MAAMIQFHRRAPGNPRRLGILSGTFNPPTRAHLALASAGLRLRPALDEVLFVLPKAFPHKTYEGARFDDRLEMLLAATAAEPRFSVGSSDGGLFIEIARECHEAYGPDIEPYFLCGRDAAERIVNWDYGRPGAFLEMLEEFDLVVASRGGAYEPPPEMRAHIHTLPLEMDFSEVSATEVRARIARGEPWEHVVPDSITGMVRRTYGGHL